MIDTNKFTENTVKAFNDAHSITKNFNQQTIKPEAFALAIVNNKDGLINKILNRMNINPKTWRRTF